ncbi:Serine--tRNA ligase, mitochondrial [Imshaugia aleurites]|uniref:serine--tRNA ligase n=1 Tax=Imshaugia aleurites TaxID=172621 RepID=A0A8H3FAA6_9LECA|nr:Serine--tRNA ligase, mitochondrial [Imshaugia aleurites]
MVKWGLQVSIPKRKLFNGHANRYLSQCGPRCRDSTAPKTYINRKHVRQNPELYSQNCLERKYKAQSDSPFKIVKLFDKWLESQKSTRERREKRNAIRTQLSRSRTFSGIQEEGQDGNGKQKTQLLEEAQDLKKQLSASEALEGQLDNEIEDLAITLPNLTSDQTPRRDEPKVLGHGNEHSNPPSTPHDRTWRNHVHIGREFDLIDFAGAATTSGWGWYYLKNEAASLERALVQYAIKVAVQHGITEVTPPSMVYTHIASRCGFQPRDQSGEQQVYGIQQSGKDEEKGKPSYSLAGTAEIPFAGMKANTVIDRADLPIRVVGSSRCYRAEAGARGVETKGLYRVHEFTKVEMFAWTAPGAENEDQIFHSMVAIQKEVLQNLGLRWRHLEMPAKDLGASAFRKQDFEVYFPSRREIDDGWGEVTSASICTDYQTRRLNTRVRNPAGSQAKMDFPSTVNGTALAVPRVLAAILENGWDDEEMCVRIPEVLWPWMDGVQAIKRKR